MRWNIAMTFDNHVEFLIILSSMTNLPRSDSNPISDGIVPLRLLTSRYKSAAQSVKKSHKNHEMDMS